MTARFTCVALLGAGAILGSGSSLGQQAGVTAPVADELAEIVVTARQRQEKLLDVPVTVQVFTANEIKSAGIERPQDFIAMTPGVSQVQTAEVGDMQVSIRGINTGRDAETNFALVIDGVLQVNPNSLNQELANIEQIEILKGPQSALYGRNAVAGAMIITTKKPGDHLDAEAKIGYGNKNTQTASLYVGGPLAPGLSGDIGAFYRKTNGFFENRLLNCDDCNDYYKETGVTPRLIFQLSDDATSTSKPSIRKSRRVRLISMQRSRCRHLRPSSAIRTSSRT